MFAESPEPCNSARRPQLVATADTFTPAVMHHTARWQPCRRLTLTSSDTRANVAVPVMPASVPGPPASAVVPAYAVKLKTSLNRDVARSPFERAGLRFTSLLTHCSDDAFWRGRSCLHPRIGVVCLRKSARLRRRGQRMCESGKRITLQTHNWSSHGERRTHRTRWHR